MSDPSSTPSLYTRWRASALASSLVLAAFTPGCGQSREQVSSQSESIVSPNNAITQGADEMRTSWYSDQAGLDPATVGGPNFKRLFKTQLPLTAGEQVLAQPLLFGNNVLVATEANNLYLVNGTTGAVVTSRALGATFDASGQLGCGDIAPGVGITGTPVIDNASGTAYFYAKNAAGIYSFHAVNAADLTERAGFPVAITGAAQNDASATFNDRFQLQRPGLLLMNGVVYAGFGAHCDDGAYRGWVIGVSTTGVVKARFATVANTPSSTVGNGIWMSGGGLASDGAGRIFFATGNGAGTEPGPIVSNAPPANLVESVARVDVQGDGSLKAMDFFAPFNAYHMADSDLSGGGIVLLPPQFGTTVVPRTALIAGKEGILYLMNRDKLGGFKQGAAGGNDVLSEIGIDGSTRSHAAVWPGDGGYAYIVASGANAANVGYRLRAFKFSPSAQNKPTISLVASAPDDFGQYSGSPIVTSNGTNSGSALVWATNLGAELRAYDAVPVNGVLNIRFRDGYGSHAKFTKPAVGNGKIYVGTADGNLVGYGTTATPVSGNAVAFGAVPVNTQKLLTATIVANQNVTITGIGASNAVFTPQASTPALPATLTAGQTLTVPVKFIPNAATAFSGSLNVTTNVGVGTVSLSGTGQATGPLLGATPPSVNFGGVAQGSTGSVNVVLQNTGTQLLTFAATTPPAAPFSVTGAPANGATLAAGASITMTAKYTPTALVTSNGNIVVNSNGGNITIPLVGTSAAPAQMVITPLSLDFGSIAAGTSKALTFTVKNTGGLTLIIQKSKPPVVGQFTAQSTLGEGQGIAPGETVIETVALSSATPGTYNDVWIITGSDSSGVQNVAFTGTVTAAVAPLSRTGWVASASNTGGGDVPANAIDASTASRFTSGIPQSNATTQSFTVDMLTAQTFTQISLDSGGDYARSYQVFTSTDGTNFGTAIATGTSTTALTTISFAAKTARYIKVNQLTSAGTGAWWSINDFNVYGTSTPPQGDGSALARTGWVGTASATAGGDVAANAVDAAAGTTRWSSGIVQSAATTQSYTLDMGSAQTFAKITLDSGGDYARSYQVFTSTDGTNFGTALVTGTGTAALTTITLPTTATARYIKVTQLTSAGAGAWWSIYDLNVYSPGGGGGGGGGTALTRTGWVASGSATGDPPANAIDGVPGSRWSTSAGQAPNQYFQVDMLAAKTFKQITLDAGGSAADYPRGYQVFVSTDGVNWGTAVATGAPTTALVTVTFTVQTARYIKVVQTATLASNWWSLYEFNVYN